MRLANIWTELLCKPWCIMPEIHQQLCEIVQAHYDGTAHIEGGIAEFGPSDPAKAQIQDGILTIPVNGVIGHRVGGMEKMSGACDVCDLQAQLQAAVEHPDVAGVLLDVSSPGGTTTGVPEAAESVAQAASEMPVLAYTDNLMASAAYWVSAPSTMIMASASARVGSIGVYMAWTDNSRANDLAGFKTELIKRGKFKAVGVDGVSLTDDQRDMLQGSVDQVYEWFTGAVRDGRGTVSDDTMQGQTFFGGDAVGVNLVDKVGSITDARQELAGLIEKGA